MKCREQVSSSEEECRAAQRELKRLQMASNDQRDALANEVNLCENLNVNLKSKSLKSSLHISFEAKEILLLSCYSIQSRSSQHLPGSPKKCLVLGSHWTGNLSFFSKLDF